MKKKYLIPPKLQQEFLMMGFNVLEIMLGVGVAAFVGADPSLFMVGILAIGCVLFCRFDKEHNAAYYVLLLCRYYGGKKQFTRR